MLKYIFQRAIALAFTLLGVSVLVFLLVHLTPGDPVRIMLGEQARPANVERLNALYGFDQPLPVQYFKWLGNALQGNLGESIRSQAPVAELPATVPPATQQQVPDSGSTHLNFPGGRSQAR